MSCLQCWVSPMQKLLDTTLKRAEAVHPPHVWKTPDRDLAAAIAVEIAVKDEAWRGVWRGTVSWSTDDDSWWHAYREQGNHPWTPPYAYSRRDHIRSEWSNHLQQAWLKGRISSNITSVYNIGALYPPHFYFNVSPWKKWPIYNNNKSQ